VDLLQHLWPIFEEGDEAGKVFLDWVGIGLEAFLSTRIFSHFLYESSYGLHHSALAHSLADLYTKIQEHEFADVLFVLHCQIPQWKLLLLLRAEEKSVLTFNDNCTIWLTLWLGVRWFAVQSLASQLSLTWLRWFGRGDVCWFGGWLLIGVIAAEKREVLQMEWALLYERRKSNRTHFLLWSFLRRLLVHGIVQFWPFLIY
jgi:hypothetical protein